MKIKIHDSTLRDGNHAAKHSLSLSIVENHCNLADRAGIYSVEVGHGNGLGASSFQIGLSPYRDLDIIKIARSSLKKSKLAVHAMPGFATFDRDIKPSVDNGVEIIRVGTHCTETNLSFDFIEKLKKLDVEVVSCLMMSHMATSEKLLEEAKRLENIGTNAISIYDSAGSFDIERVEELFKILSENLNIPFGFHGHNNLGLAVANSYFACKNGATIVDASICAYGAGAGNTQFEALASYLESKGYKTEINLEKLYDLVTYASSTYASNKPFPSTLGIVSGISGVFSGFSNHVIKASAIYNVNELELFKVLGKKGIVGGQEDHIYSVASSISNNKKKIKRKPSNPNYQKLEFIEKRSRPRKVTLKEYKERAKYSILGRGKIIENNNDPLQEILLDNVKNQGRLYYDGPRFLGYGGYNKKEFHWANIAKELIEVFRLERSMSILDIGCAKGYLVEAFSNLYFEKAYGIDSSSYAINTSETNIKDRLIESSLLKIPFPSKFFDMSFCIDVLQELPESLIPAAIREINRVSKKSLIAVPVINSEIQNKKEQFLSWSISAQTAISEEKWIKIFKDSGYESFYSFFSINLKIS